MDRLNRLLTLYAEDKSDSFILFALALEYKNLHAYNEAIFYFDKLMDLDQNYVGLYYHYADTLIDDNQLNEALKIYEKGIEIAQAINDQHALSELQNAKVNFEIEYL